MDIEKMLVHLGDAQRISSREEMIKRTVKSSEEVFFKNEENRLLRWGEFLLSQAWLIQKRWWLLQMGLSMLLWSCRACGFGVRFTEKNHGHRRMCLRDTHDP